MPDGREAMIHQDSLQDIWNSQTLIDMRKSMLDGRKHASCEKCYAEEKIGKESIRQCSNLDWSLKLGVKEIERLTRESILKDGKAHFSPYYLNLRLGSQCNLRCRMCFPVSSSGIFAEYKSLIDEGEPFPEIFKNDPVLKNQNLNDSWLDDLQFDSNLEEAIPFIKEIYFTGGEPMLGKNLSKVLQKIVNSGHAHKIDLKFHTNTTIWNEEVMSRLPRFKSVIINCSIDGVGAVDEYVRFPTKFSNVEAVFERYLAFSEIHPAIEVKVACSVSVLNVFDLSMLAEWYSQKSSRSGRLTELKFSLVHEPDFLNLKMLPEFLRRDALAEIDRAMSFQKFLSKKSLWTYDSLLAIKKYIKALKDAPSAELSDQLVLFQRTLDARRKQSLKGVHPHLQALLAFYGKSDHKFSSTEPTAKKVLPKIAAMHLGWIGWKATLRLLAIKNSSGRFLKFKSGK
jgi:MoaA/NifB/PqqE/SkfB family radical SAM enzyme